MMTTKSDFDKNLIQLKPQFSLKLGYFWSKSDHFWKQWSVNAKLCQLIYQIRSKIVRTIFDPARPFSTLIDHLWSNSAYKDIIFNQNHFDVDLITSAYNVPISKSRIVFGIYKTCYFFEMVKASLKLTLKKSGFNFSQNELHILFSFHL